MDSQSPIQTLNRVGSALAARLKRLGIDTARNLLFYFPFRYEDYSQVTKINQLADGAQATIRARIEAIAARRSPRKRKLLTEAVVSDDTGQLRIIWFGQPFIAKTLKAGDEVYFSGRATRDMLGPQLVSPGYEKITPPAPSLERLGTGSNRGGLGTTHTARIVPMYPLTEGLTHKQIRYLLKQVIHLADEIDDWLPPEILKKAQLPPLKKALRGIHFPESEEELKTSTTRLKFDELYILQLRAEMIRQSLARQTAPAILFDAEPIKKFVSELPFALTKDQKVTAWEIFQDMAKSEPMNRLLEGDVGSGKTVVATMAMYQAALRGFQSAIMAPTEILASQHFETMSRLLEPFGVPVALITSNKQQSVIPNPPSPRGGEESFSDKLRRDSSPSKTQVRNDVLTSIANGDVPIIIGTHALLTEDVRFKNLGLVIVDEQHRFGVEQRRIIREKSDSTLIPHFLSMTATPIPRSFALTLYGDLDISMIKQMPVGRKIIKTKVVVPHLREKAYGFIREQVKQGRQVFVICPLIDQKTDNNPATAGQITNNIGDKKSVMKEYEHLSKEIFTDLNVGFLHGKMKPKEKDAVMKKFADGEINILVSTSVVEVGVNIPNASVMMIEGAERFGLAQLHQFRGRVGRSEHQSYCFLFTESDSRRVAERLVLFEKTTDGFALAEYDLQTRGPGEVYGTAQSGLMNLRLATMKDVGIIRLARDLAKGMDFARFPGLKEKVREWEESVHLE